MPTLAELRQQNENIEMQLREWKQQRFANGENPIDWVAFREHMRQVGAPDPGEFPPDEFYQWDESLVGGTPDQFGEHKAAFGKSSDVSPEERDR